jgi:hypothetical protein
MPVRLLLRRHGDRSFNDLLQKLRCEKCGSHPAPVYLCASHFRRGNSLGAMADWSVEFVSPPQPPQPLAHRSTWQTPPAMVI